MSKYVSPMVRARAIVYGQEKNVSRKERRVAEKMVHLHPNFIVDLEREHAPKHVFRWVADGASITLHRRRVDLVLHLRRSIARPRNGWFEERHFTAALAVLEGARDAVRRHGGIIMPSVNEIPLDAYGAAVDGATKKKRVRALEPELKAAIETDEPSSPEGEDDADGEGSDDADGEGSDDDEREGDDDDDEREGNDDDEREGNDDGEGEDGGSPVSERLPLGRARTLRCLSNAARRALASGDVEGADEINALISRLCARRKAG